MDIRPTGNAVHVNAYLPDRNSTPAVETTGAPASVAAPTVTAAAIQQPDPAAALAQVTQAVKSINKSLKDNAQGIEFSVDKDSERVIVKVVDQNTKELIRQMPTEEALEIAKALDHALGMIIKQQA